MCDITQTFTAIHKGLESVNVYMRGDIIETIIKEMGLEGRDEYLAMKAYGFLMYTDLDYEEAYAVLGKETVDEWIKNGSYADDFHPMAYQNLDYWCDPIARQKYYEEYLEGVKMRRTGSIGVKLHPNFTLAEIEHAMRNK
jgi:hypothetical protein